MATALLVLHLMIAAALVGVVLLQKSEGGGLGMGSSGGSGGFLTGRGTANLLTRTTAALAAAFFATSIALTLVANRGAPQGSAFERVTPGAPAAPTDGSKPAEGRGGILDKLQPPTAPNPVDVPLNR